MVFQITKSQPLWSQNRNDPNAENARWIYEHSNGFILFIDCDD